MVPLEGAEGRKCQCYNVNKQRPSVYLNTNFVRQILCCLGRVDLGVVKLPRVNAPLFNKGRSIHIAFFAVISFTTLKCSSLYVW